MLLVDMLCLTHKLSDRLAFVVLADSAGRVRLEHPSAFQQSGLSMVGEVDGQRVMAWSGGAVSSYLPEGKK